MGRPTYSIEKGMQAINNPCVTEEDLNWRKAVNAFFGYVDSDYEPPTAEGVFSVAAFQRRKATERNAQL
ncbi:MAG: hypothetical protein EOP20_00355 [Hyphomicrobiales bacterium]|nr:MAG: hypothetical protein EOP20_00355 [Hyphomicrobiales bacterium]